MLIEHRRLALLYQYFSFVRDNFFTWNILRKLCLYNRLICLIIFLPLLKQVYYILSNNFFIPQASYILPSLIYQNESIILSYIFYSDSNRKHVNKLLKQLGLHTRTQFNGILLSRHMRQAHNSTLNQH